MASVRHTLQTPSLSRYLVCSRTLTLSFAPRHQQPLKHSQKANMASELLFHPLTSSLVDRPSNRMLPPPAR